MRVEGANLRQLSHQNDWLKDVKLGQVIETSFQNKDGTEVHGYRHDAAIGGGAASRDSLRTRRAGVAMGPVVGFRHRSISQPKATT